MGSIPSVVTRTTHRTRHVTPDNMKVELLELYEEHRKYRGLEIFIHGEGYPKLWKFAPLREVWDEDSDEFDALYRNVGVIAVRASQYVRRIQRRENARRHNGA